MTDDVKQVVPADLQEKFIIFRGQITKLTRNSDGFWSDNLGTLYAYAEGPVADPVNRCGISPLALPTSEFFQPINDACAPHDFAYDSPVYQAFHTREDADDYLDELQTLAGHPLLGSIFEEVARLLGAPYWENPKTND